MMNNREFIERLNAETGIGLGKSKEVLRAVFGILAEEIALGNDVRISKFGTFQIKVREARMGFNVQTREPMEIPAKKKLVFKPTIALKNLVEETL